MKLNNTEIEIIATQTARDIFAAGHKPGSPTQRIQFMGGKYPENEKGQGGLCEIALVETLKMSLRKQLL